MGMTYVRAKVSRPTGRGQSIDVRFLVDTGAVYTVLPEDVWPALKLKPQRTVEFTLADGTIISRQVSECRCTIEGQSATLQSYWARRRTRPCSALLPLRR